MEHILIVVTERKQCQTLRKFLEDLNLLRRDYRIKKLEDGRVAIPVLNEIISHDTTQKHKDGEFSVKINDIQFSLQTVESSSHSEKMKPSLHRKLVAVLRDNMEKRGVLWTGKLERDVPQRWEKHGDMVLIHGSSFQDPEWKQLGPSAWELVAEVLSARRIAKKYRIEKDSFRTPHVELLLGEECWVTRVENGIKYSWEVSRCMFSAGNISEKLRVSMMDCSGETVVDLYAGIGYFVLPYLVHAGAELVHACEWNPAAVQALHFNLKQNGVEDRCIIHEGDNRQVCPVGVADRVNVGLIPSSSAGWPVACQALRKDHGGILHVHGNVESGKHSPVKDSNGSHSAITVQSETNLVKQNFHDANHFESCNLENSELEISGVVKDKEYMHKVEVKCKKKEWKYWMRETAAAIQHILTDLHKNPWSVQILHLEHVKSYAAHVDHLVIDLHCKPSLKVEQ